MTRLTTSYVGLLLFFIVALWFVLRQGAELRAPEDLSGFWETSDPIAAVPDRNRINSLHIDQSGRHIELSRDNSLPMKYVLRRQTLTPLEGGQLVTMELAGDQGQLVVQGRAESDAFAFRFGGETTAVINMRRVSHPDTHSTPTATRH